MTTTLTRRWPSSLTPGDVGKHVTVIAPGENITVAAGVLLAVAHHKDDSGPHTHLAVRAPYTISDIVTSDRHGIVLVNPTPRSARNATTHPLPATRPANAHHPRRRDRALALTARAAARVRGGIVGAALATATGRSLTVAFALALMWAGIELTFAVPPRTIAQLLGAGLFGAGGGILIRLWAVADRMRSRS